MTMREMNPFARTDVPPSWWANAIQKFLSIGAHGFYLTRVDNTHIQVTAGPADQSAAVAIGGLWRWVEATVGPIAHPGGAAGNYPIFVTAKNNAIVSTPLPYTDNTDYSFGLTILAPGATPAIVAGSVDVYRQVGVAEWDGAKIVRVDQTVPLSPSHSNRHVAAGPDPLSPTDIGAPTWKIGTHAARLAQAASDGLLYRETDTGARLLGNGSGWVPLGLAQVNANTSVTAGNGQMVLYYGLGGHAITLPAASQDQVIAITCQKQTLLSPLTIVATGGAVILGRGISLSGATSIQISATGAIVVLRSDNANWYIVGGAIDTGWLNMSPVNGVTLGSGDPAQARRIGDLVHLKGELVAASGGMTAFENYASTGVLGGNPSYFTALVGLTPTAFYYSGGQIGCPVAVGAGSTVRLGGVVLAAA